MTAATALFMNANFALMNGATAGGVIDGVFIVLEIVLIIFAARQALSLDTVLARRRVEAPVVTGIPRDAASASVARSPSPRVP